jgi:hypothetical protein
MLRYDHLKDHPRDFLTATGLTLAEFALLLPAFEAAYDDLYPPHLTATEARQRQGGVVRKGCSWTGKISCCLFWFIRRPTPCRPCKVCTLG